MIHNLFSLPIYKVNLSNRGLDLEGLQDFLYPVFQETFVKGQEPLEKQGGNSTYSWSNQLHTCSELDQLNKIVLEHAKIYWRVLDINPQLSPRIDMCWSNLHRQNSYTDLHSHSMLPMVATFYVKAEPNNGNIIFINPMEYSITHLPVNNVIKKIETELEVRSGDLLLFPGWLRHKTGPNLSDQHRIVLSYNLSYQGQYLASQIDYPSVDPNVYLESQEPNLPSDNNTIKELTNLIVEQEFIIKELSQHLLQQK